MGRIRGTKGLVGGEDWEEDGDDGASICERKTLRGMGSFEGGKRGSRWGRGGATHESKLGTISNKPMFSNRGLRVVDREIGVYVVNEEIEGLSDNAREKTSYFTLKYSLQVSCRSKVK